MTAAVGIDLSLVRTGVATATGADSLTPPRGLTGFPRLRWIRAAVLDWTRHADLVVIEGLSYASHTPSALERAGLWHLIVERIDANSTRYVVVPPATRAKYATGNGHAGKDEVLAAAIKRLPIDVTNNDEADSAWLCAAGHDLLGQPLCQLPNTHTTALTSIRATFAPHSRVSA